jgi:hypothetical protein
VTDVPLDPIAIDVGSLLQRTVTSLYAHLVTRPTGRAVRMAIETQLSGAGDRSLSVIDLSEVSILDFSCADEVVAKLLQRYVDGGPHEAFFVFSGVHDPHRDQIQVVLERQQLAAVVETGDGRFELLGAFEAAERRVWLMIEERGLLASDEISELFPASADIEVLERIVERRLAFRSPISGRIHALSRLVRQVM